MRFLPILRKPIIIRITPIVKDLVQDPWHNGLSPVCSPRSDLDLRDLGAGMLAEDAE